MIIFGPPPKACGWWLYDVESLEDLYEAYAVGDIDYTTLTLLAGSYDLGGLDQSDLLAIGAIERHAPPFPVGDSLSGFLWPGILEPQRGKFGIRRTSNGAGEISSRYYLNVSGKLWKASGLAEEKGGHYTWDRRSLTGMIGPAELTIGNYVAAEGFGLAIGRLDFQPSAGLPTVRDEGFLYPVNSYYNGLKLRIAANSISSGMYYSEKKYETALKQFWGGGIKAATGRFLAGISAGINRLKQDGKKDDRLAIGFAAGFIGALYGLSGEYAYIDRSPGLFLSAERRFGEKIARTEFWRYDTDFKNYNCSGPAAADYGSFYPEDVELGFRSAQAGEAGLLASYGTPYASLSAQFWNQLQAEAISGSVGFHLRGRVVYKAEAFIQGAVSDKVNTDYRWIKFGILPGKGPVERLGLMLHARQSPKISHVYSYAFFDITGTIIKNLKAYCRFKEYFNGRNRLLFGERLYLDWGLNAHIEALIDRQTVVNLKIEKAL